MACARSAGKSLLIKNFTLNSSHQVVVKVVREILNLFAMEVPALAKEPVEYVEYTGLLM